MSRGGAPLPEAEELIVRLDARLQDLTTREQDRERQLEQALAKASAEAERASTEAGRAERLAARLRALGVDPEE